MLRTIADGGATLTRVTHNVNVFDRSSSHSDSSRQSGCYLRPPVPRW